MSRILPFLILLLCAVAPTPGRTDSGHVIRIGVRIDAAPFAYKTPPPKGETDIRPTTFALGPTDTLGQTYGGYIIRVCDAVIADMRRRKSTISFGVVEVTATNRIEMLQDGSIDVLCDPASITPERNQQFLASVPIYLSGISFASHPATDLRDQPDVACMYSVGVVDQTTAEASGALTIAASGEWSAGGVRDDRKPSSATDVRGFLQGNRNAEDYGTFETCANLATLSRWLDPKPEKEVAGASATAAAHALSSLLNSAQAAQLMQAIETVEPLIKDPKEQKALEAARAKVWDALGPVTARAKNVVPVRAYPSHAALARDFCAFKIRYYVGDIEIINHALSAARCSFADASRTYTAERYAIYVRMPNCRDPATYAGDAMLFLQLLAAQVYDPDSVLIRAYNATFPRTTPTRQLQALIWSLSGDFPK